MFGLCRERLAIIEMGFSLELFWERFYIGWSWIGWGLGVRSEFLANLFLNLFKTSFL